MEPNEAPVPRCGAAIHPTLGRCVRSDFHDGDHEATNGETWGEPAFRPIIHRIIDLETENQELRAALSTAERERDEMRDTLRYFVDRFSIQGTADSERYDRALALLARVPSGGEEGR